MAFTFLKYIQPTHYFQLQRKDGGFIYPLVQNLSDDVKKGLVPDKGYQSELAMAYDQAWQAIQRGYIGEAVTHLNFEKLPVSDEYRFIRKNFHPIWSIYVLLIRLLSLKNPITEISGFLKNKGVKRYSLVEGSFRYADFDFFQSNLISKNPMVSVLIPTLNRYEYLKDVLMDFERQTYNQFEIVIVDQSKPFNSQFYDEFKLTIQLIRQEEPALWLARNTAVQRAKGEIIMLSEDDVRISPDWIENHLKCLDYFDAEISAGVFFPEGSSIPKERSFFAVASQFATGNAALYKEVFRKIGLFDRQFERQRMGDGEFGLRAYLNGIKSVSNPNASCIDVKADTGGLRQMGSWDAFRPKKWFAPRPIPSVLYYFRRYYGNSRARWALLKTVPPSLVPYRFKKNKKLLILGIFISVLLLPVVLIQVGRSWQLASRKLKQGPLISELD